MLRCADNSLYTGIAADIVKRIKQHLGVLAGGAKYTHSHRVIYIEAVWKFDSDKIARKLEYRLKRLSHIQKEILLQNPDDISLVCSEILFGLQIKFQNILKKYHQDFVKESLSEYDSARLSLYSSFLAILSESNFHTASIYITR